jgi:hypothetical protein
MIEHLTKVKNILMIPKAYLRDKKKHNTKVVGDIVLFLMDNCSDDCNGNGDDDGNDDGDSGDGDSDYDASNSDSGGSNRNSSGKNNNQLKPADENAATAVDAALASILLAS